MKQKNKRSNSVTASLSASAPPLWVRVFIWFLWAGAGILALCALAQTVGQTADISRFAEQGWGQYAPVIVGNKIRALWHAAFMTAVAGAALWWMVGRNGLAGRGAGGEGQRSEARGQKSEEPSSPSGYDVPRKDVKGAQRAVFNESFDPRPSTLVPLLLVLIVAVDAWWLSRNYVKTMPMSALDENPVIAILKKDMPEHRVALVSQDGFYNWWLTYLFPYHGILTVNITQMPRMPADYKAFLGAVGRNPLRMWQLSAVGYVLAPAQVWRQVQHDPAWSNAFELVCGYNVGPAEAGVSVIPVWSAKQETGDRRQETEVRGQKPEDIGQHVVMRLVLPAPRFALIGATREVADDEALKLLASPTYDLFREVLVAPAVVGRGERGESGPDAVNARVNTGGPLTNAGVVGTCRLVNYRSGRMEIEVKAEKAGMLRVSEKYDKDWKATVDGAPVPVARVDYIVQGVRVPAGDHRVLLRYAPAIWPLYVQGAGMLIVLGAIVWLVVEKARRKSPDTGRLA